MKRISLVLWICLWITYSPGQSVPRLHVGDTMPPIQLPLLNYGDSSLHLADIRNKLVILSFWTPSCAFSTSQLPILDTLQQQFPVDLRILPVAFDGFEKGLAKRYIEKQKNTLGEVALGSALHPFEDTLLYHQLPYMGLPQNIWLDSNHVITAITDHFALTEENIKAELAGGHPLLELKDYDFNFDANKPLLVGGNGGEDNAFSYRSLITPYKPFILFSGVAQRTPSFIRIAEGNQTPVALLQIAMAGCDSTRKLPDYDPLNKRLRNLVRGNELFDTSYFDFPRREYAKAEEMRKKQAFCYELILPPRFSFGEAYGKMLTDLCDYFGVTAAIERQRVPTFLIIKKGKLQKEAQQGEEAIHISTDSLVFSFSHCTLRRVAEVLNNVLEIRILSDATGTTEKLSLAFRLSSLQDTEGLEKSLRVFHLALKKKSAPTNLFVIRNR